MKTNKTRFSAAIMASILALGVLAGCQGGEGAKTGTTSKSESASASATSTANADKVYNIGICQLVQHPALDNATKGFEDKLTELMGKDKVKFDLQNAQNDTPTCATISNQFVASGYDLILGNATAALQSAATATTTIPVLGTSITDYANALDMKDFKGTSGRNVSGTCDLAPLDKQAEMIHELFPDAKNVGILYCSAEPNSKYQSTTITEYLTKYGYNVKEFTFSDSNDIAQVTTNSCNESDVIYVPTDNTAASNANLIDNIAKPAKTPIVAGEKSICEGCGIATLSIDYYELGEKTGEMAYNILAKGQDISTYEIQYAPTTKKMYMKDRAEEIGVTIPDSYEAITSED